MEKKIVMFSFVVAVLIGLGIIMFLRWQSNNKIAVTMSATQKIDANAGRNAVNKNKYFLYMIEGKIDKIYDPFKLDVKVDIYKIFSDQKNKTIVKTVVVKNDTEFVLHDQKTNKDTSKDVPIEVSSLNVGDVIAVWTVEPNSNILKLDQFTAVKIVKFK